MAVELLHPEGLHRVPDYHHVAIASGSRQIHLAGQVAWDADGTLVGADDLAAQVLQVHRNIATALAAAGAEPRDIVRITWYVAGWGPDLYPAFAAGVEAAARELDLTAPPASLIGVEALFDPEILVEAEVTAVV